MTAADAVRRARWGWGWYSWGNHGFSTAILVGLFPIFFDKYWAGTLGGTISTFYLGLANSSASFVVMLLAPWLGAIADRRAWKKPLLLGFTGLGVLGTAALAFVGKGQWQLAAAVFAIASIGFYLSYSLLDSLIVRVAAAHETDRVSAFGFAMGYLGGGLIFLLDVLVVLMPQRFGLPDKVAATRLAFISVAIWWAAFAIPLARWVDEPRAVAEAPSWRELLATLRHALANRPVITFLVAYWLYIDAVGTVQQMAVDFGAKLGFSTDALIEALLMVQFISFPAAIGFGRLAGRIGTKRAIYTGLFCFVGVTIWGYFLHTVRQFFLMAGMVALAQGGVQSLSRSYFARLIPAERAGEYFGFYNMLGKFAAVLGPLTVGTIARWSGNPRLGILALIVFFLGGIALLSLSRAPEARTR